MHQQPDVSQYTKKSLEELRQSQERLNNRHAPSITEIPKAYAEKMNQHQQAVTADEIIQRAMNLVVRPSKALPQFMDYETAKHIVWKIGNGILEQTKKTWIVEESQKKIVEDLVKYFINDPSGRHELTKGIYMFGDVGRGKTFLFKVMQIFCQASNNQSRIFKFANCADISDRALWAKDGMNDVIASYCSEAWFFDDLGNEPSAIKSFGNEIQVMERILMQRYPKFVNGNCITHITSNDTPEDFKNKYGSRLADRANEMFNFVMLTGSSKRQ